MSYTSNIEDIIRLAVNNYYKLNISTPCNSNISVTKKNDMLYEATVPIKGNIPFRSICNDLSEEGMLSLDVREGHEVALWGLKDDKLVFMVKTTKETTYDFSEVPYYWDITINPRGSDNEEIKITYNVDGTPDSRILIRRDSDTYVFEVQDKNADDLYLDRPLPIAESMEVDSTDKVQELITKMTEEYPLEETLKSQHST